MKRINGSFPFFLLFLVSLLLLCVLVSVCCGHYSISAEASLRILLSALTKPIDYRSSMDTTIIFGLRLPRILGAILVGAALSLAGATYQSIFQNPLVSPDILGASSGACVGAAFGILMHFSKTVVVFLSFGVGILTVIIAMIIPKLLKSSSNLILVLSGIIVGGIMDSIMGIIKYVADPQSELPQIIYWTMGALDNVTYLDYGNQIKMLKLIKKLNRYGFFILATTHDPNHCVMLNSQVGILDKTGVLHVGTNEEMLSDDILSKLFGTKIHMVYADIVKRNTFVLADLIE